MKRPRIIRLFLLIAAMSGCGSVPLRENNALYERRRVGEETVHLFDVDFERFHVAIQTAQALAKTSDLAKDTKAGVNAGFFQADGTPAGLLAIDGKILAKQSKPRAAIGWKRNGETIIDRVTYTGANQGFVSQTGNTTAVRWQSMDFVMGGTPLLVVDARAIEDFSAENVNARFLAEKHARTAICVHKDAHWTLAVIEGSSSLSSAIPFWGAPRGFTMLELAHFLADELRCKAAINLDGGGSSVMVVDGQVVSQTTFDEREVANTIVVIAK